MGETPEFVNSNQLKYGGYYYHMQRGLSWFFTASMLKNAADKILDAHERALQIYENSGDFEGYLVTDPYVISIEQDMSLFPTYMLLMGYSLENLIKGVVICEMRLRDQKFFDNDFNKLRVTRKRGRGYVKIASHDLFALFDAEVADISITASEYGILKQLEKYIKWGGRYPIDTKCSHEGLPCGIIYRCHEEPSIINAIYEKVVTVLLDLDREQAKHLNKK